MAARATTSGQARNGAKKTGAFCRKPIARKACKSRAFFMQKAARCFATPGGNENVLLFFKKQTTT
jgi:hypothetical protein